MMITLITSFLPTVCHLQFRTPKVNPMISFKVSPTLDLSVWNETIWTIVIARLSTTKRSREYDGKCKELVSGCPLVWNFKIQPIFIQKWSFSSFYGSNFILFSSHAKNFDIKFQPYKTMNIWLSTLLSYPLIPRTTLKFVLHFYKFHGAFDEACNF